MTEQLVEQYPGYIKVKWSEVTIGDIVFIDNFQRGKFPRANPHISGPYTVAGDHLLRTTWTIKGQYRTFRNSLEDLLKETD